MRSDEGFSLSELIIVLGLMGFVLAAIYAADQALVKGGQVSETQARFSRDSGESVRLSEKSIMQMIKLESADAYSMTFLTDRNLDDLAERIKITATTASDAKPHSFRYEVWQLNAARTTATRLTDIYWTDICYNAPRGVPLFRYYNAAGLEITPTEALTAARSIRMQMLLSYLGSDFKGDKIVYLRNMSQ
jgi:prepilin-type N-terminal cleavage/methylation domain-containing protein